VIVVLACDLSSNLVTFEQHYPPFGPIVLPWEDSSMSEYSHFFRPQSLEQVVKELQSNIPRRSDDDDPADHSLRQHEDRYRRFRLKYGDQRQSHQHVSLQNQV
jgi:hypothetical protein